MALEDAGPACETPKGRKRTVSKGNDSGPKINGSQIDNTADIDGHASTTGGFAISKRPRLSATPDKDFIDWSADEVAEQMEKRRLPDAAARVFRSENISGQVLPLLTEDRLRSMGFNDFGTRLLLLQFIDEVKDTVPHSFINRHGNDKKVFNDPVHGHIKVHQLCTKIINTPQFQRLRNIKQLGACYFVFPGASHNRFEHCLGTCHLAGKFARALQKGQPELCITEEDILCVEIAGLCHDLGHGPFSHLFDGKFIPSVRPGLNWQHEKTSIDMFDHLVASNDLEGWFEQYNLYERDRLFIKEQIYGPLQSQSSKHDWAYKGRGRSKSFLYEIVSNKRNGVDVDKWDYFARDCHNLGIKNNFDHSRFIAFARVIKVDDELQICARDKEAGNLYDMFHTRNSLHRRAYQHKVNNIVEVMIVEALKKANNYLKITGTDGKLLKMSEAIDDMVAFTNLTDHVFYEILYSSDPNLKDARQIAERIFRRDLYSCVGQSQPNKGIKIDAHTVVKEIVSICSEEELDGCSALTEDDIVIQHIVLDYGMRDKNPVDRVRFYSKGEPNVAKQIRRAEVSHMLPETFAEHQLRIICKRSDIASQELAASCFRKWCEMKKLPVPKSEVNYLELTPLKAGAPESHYSNREEVDSAASRLSL